MEVSAAKPDAQERRCTHLLRTNEVPVIQAGLETLQRQGSRRVRLGPAGPQGAEGVGVVDLVVEEVAAGPLVQLDGVDVGRLLGLDQLVDGDQHGALFEGAVQLGLGRHLDGLTGSVSWEWCLTLISHTS